MFPHFICICALILPSVDEIGNDFDVLLDPIVRKCLFLRNLETAVTPSLLSMLNFMTGRNLAPVQRE